LANGECVGNFTKRYEPITGSLGCYVFKKNSTSDSLKGLESIGFPDPYRDGILMDPGLCDIYCANYLFNFTALRKGNECRCGNQNGLESYDLTDSSNCTIPCVGNSSYICGGEEAYSVYNITFNMNKLPISGIPPIDKKVFIINNLKNATNYLGCIRDSPYCGVRALKGMEKETDNMTVDICIDYCRQNNFKYAGLEIGTQCFCDNTYVNITELNPRDCGSSCVGNGSQICGGPLALSIYTVTQYAATQNSDNHRILYISVGVGSGLFFIYVLVSFFYWRYRYRYRKLLMLFIPSSESR
ncbi:8201_t:CDS:1, partial [Acaulospora morrowiae]